MLNTKISVYLESGSKRTFAGAIDWPGWCRSGKNEPSALQALLDYAPRYAEVLNAAGLPFSYPDGIDSFDVTERLEGNGNTDFGAPAIPPSGDSAPMGAEELDRLQAILLACWQALERAAQSAQGIELRKGPRGGGRDLEGVINHVVEAEAHYLSKLGWKLSKREGLDIAGKLKLVQSADRDALAQAARGETASQGPRGGSRWSPRYFTRRAAWHILDHVWEIEDRKI